MDSFVDKLAQRFNAGELIKANGEAEALEADRLKAQADEYDKMMKEVRRLNLKTVELSEQVSQLIQCGIEQIEAYGAAGKNNGEEDGEEQQLLKDLIADGIEKQKESFLKIASNQQDMLIESMENQQEIMNTFAVNSLQTQQESMKRLEDRLTTLRAAIEESLTDMETSLRIGVKDYEPMMQAIHNDNLVNKAAVDENMNQMKEMITRTRLLMDEQSKQLLDFVHKENVKVYRNVQAVVNDQTSLRAKELAVQLERVEKKTGRPSLLLVCTFLLAAGSLALQVLRMFGIL